MLSLLKEYLRMRRRGVPTLVILLTATLAASPQVAAQNGNAAAQATAQQPGGTGPAGQAPVPPQPADLTQQPPAHGDEPPEAEGDRERRPPPFPAHQRPPAPQAVLDRGKTMYASMCSACHGADARGGQLGGVNLLRSPTVLGDRDGELVLPIVKNGRPGTAMAAMPLPDDDTKAIVAFLHSLQAAGSNQGGPPPGPPVELNIVVGDAKAGAAYFATTCASCHSPSDDLAGIASRVPDAKALQSLWVSGGRASGRGPGRRRRPVEQAASATVRLPHEVVQGRIVRIDDFLVTLALEDGTTRTIRRSGNTPPVEITDPLARHNALLARYTNKTMHDVTAYLATLK
jgi:cytochrome c oxidase cbb3-type subunit 3